MREREMALLSVVAGTYNEEANVTELYERVCRTFAEHLPGHEFEMILIDNASTDRTVEVLKRLAAGDRRLKIIVNNRNFGNVRSGYYGVLQATGDAVVAIASDLQDPPELIPEFVRKWEEGYKIVLAQKTDSEESALFFLVRKTYYSTINKLSDIPLVKNTTGFGLYDRRVIEDIRKVNDPYPYLRGLICDLGYERALIQFTQPLRRRGFSKSNFYSLWDTAMLGITNHSKVPLRLATFGGLIVSGMSFLVAFGYLIYKLLYWDSFQLGLAPLIIGMFFIGAVQLIFIGLLGEYIGAIHTQILRRPPVIEKERINFDEPAGQPGAAAMPARLVEPQMNTADRR
jgi:glycosyltransferase involved in cell wall biosynthesis